MSETHPFSSRTLYDTLSLFPDGINSDVDPVLIPKTTLAWSMNASLRGGFVHQRPPYLKRLMVFSSVDVQSVVESGFFQGAGYYRPDFGPQQLVAQISGRLFTFTPNAENEFLVSEITIPGDPNDAMVGQVWMNQAEKWLIITDGTSKLPIFWDGVLARRSFGPSVVLGTVSAGVPANFPATRVIGEIIEVQLTANWTGPYDVPVFFNDHFYQTKQTSGDGYDAILTNGFNTPVTALTIGQSVEIRPDPVTTNATIVSATSLNQSFVGAVFVPTGNNQCQQIIPPTGNPVTQTVFTGNWNIPALTQITITLSDALPTVPTSISIPLRQLSDVVGCASSIGPFTNTAAASDQTVPWQVLSASADRKTFVLQLSSAFNGVSEGQTFSSGLFGYYNNTERFNSTQFQVRLNVPISSFSTTQPTIVVGKLLANETSPTAGNSVTILLDSLFGGPDLQTVFIGSNKFQLSVALPPGPTTTLFLINLTDNTDAGAAVPTGSPAGDILSVPELPAGRMGAYGLGHQVMSLVDGISFLYGDAVGGPAGSPANNYRDAVLKTTENTFQKGGGTFRIPNSGEIITSMKFAAVLDAAYAQGPLQLGTPTSIFTCAVPTVRADWILIENPILTQTLIGRGPLGQNSTIPVNSDTFFRNSDGEGSMIFGRRDFVTWGNTPISAEVGRVMARDDQTLLSVGSAVTFDNRFLGTASPRTSGQGTFHTSATDLNFDPVSSLRGKALSIWESLWTGINAFQYLTGIFGSTERCFAFTLNDALNKIEIYEVTRELPPGMSGNTYDNEQTPITWSFETAALFNRDVKPRETMVSLRDGEFGVSNVIGNVRFAVYYRPDQHSCWIPWHSFVICGGSGEAQNFPRLGLGEPSVSRCIASLNAPARDFYTVQIKFVVQGTCTFNYARFMAVTMPTPKFLNPICQDNDPICIPDACTNVADGSTDNLFYSLQNDVFTNTEQISHIPQCPEGMVCPPGSLPPVITYPPGHFTLPNPIFGGGLGPTPEFSTFLGIKGCSTFIFVWVPQGGDLAFYANQVIQAVAAEQALCDTLEILNA